MNYGLLAVCLFGLVVLYVLIWVFLKPFKKLARILVNSALGAGALWLFNALFSATGFFIGVNVFSALVCGILGPPGFLLLSAGKLFLGV